MSARVLCALVLGILLVSARARSHESGLNKCGCHHNRKTGECHCHRNSGCGCECQSPSCEVGFGSGETEPHAEECGVPRWRVKVLTDSDADKVRIDSPRRGTIEELQAMTSTYADMSPRSPAEVQVFAVEGWLLGYELEADSDLHAIIGNDAGRTIIVEFPHPDCMLGSRVLKQATEARAKFRHLVHTPMTTHYVQEQKQIRVRVTGILFFDRLHGKIGVAPNGVELHPVLDIEAVPYERDFRVPGEWFRSSTDSRSFTTAP